MGREGEKRQCVRETSTGCLSHAPYWGPGSQLRHVPWLGIKLAALGVAGRHSIHWATPARAIQKFVTKCYQFKSSDKNMPWLTGVYQGMQNWFNIQKIKQCNSPHLQTKKWKQIRCSSQQMQKIWQILTFNNVLGRKNNSVNFLTSDIQCSGVSDEMPSMKKRLGRKKIFSALLGSLPGLIIKLT